ncbi:hypothetical protein R1sor_010937 [Riccia sorocarpa]|uniref:PLAC8 family protein n=1 Tax=Riccia sorocarpa TaxID=122646 RepID=A0ABD3I0S1_9MARC
MTGAEDRNGVPKIKPPSASRKGLFSSFRENGQDVNSTPEQESSTGSKTSSSFFPSPKSASRSPVPVPPVAAVLSMNTGPLKNGLTKILTPSRTFTRLRDERDEISRLTPTPRSIPCFKEEIKLPLIGKVRVDELLAAARKWLRNPKNLALLIWGLAVGVSGALLFMVMVGMLDNALPDKHKRDTLFEVNNQILNALFTLMCVYVHPARCFHLHMLIRWTPTDILKLREIYCKNGTRKPHEWAHMLVVVLLLQLNCWAQYALCGLNWGYRRADRPALGVGLCLCLSLGGAAGAGIYNTLSPLGKDFDLDADSSADDVEKASSSEDEPRPMKHKQYAARTKFYRLLERRMSFADRQGGTSVDNPAWRGGLFDCGQDKPIAVLSTVCCPCVFGWTLDRLGFGNRYVHIMTFALLCTAPFWIFDLAAVNIDNRIVRRSIAGAGIVLCAFGLLYGGFWRIRMRERYKLPPNKCCCGHANVTDCAQWMFCPLCSLCQEVRTAEYYEVRDDKFFPREFRDVASPLPTSPPRDISPGSPANGSHSLTTPAATLLGVKEMPSTGTKASSDIELGGLSLNPFLTPGEVLATNGRSPPRPTNPFLTPEVLASFDPMAPPVSVTASRDSSNSGHRVASAALSGHESRSVGDEADSTTVQNRPSVQFEHTVSPTLPVHASRSSSPLRDYSVQAAVSRSPRGSSPLREHSVQAAMSTSPRGSSPLREYSSSPRGSSPLRERSVQAAVSSSPPGSSPFREHSVQAAVSSSPRGGSPLKEHSAQAAVSSSPRSVPTSPARMFLHTEEGAYDFPDDVPRRRSFLQEPLGEEILVYQGSQGAPSSVEGDELVRVSHINPFLDPKLNALPVSSKSEDTGVGRPLHMDDINQGSPRFSVDAGDIIINKLTGFHLYYVVIFSPHREAEQKLG